MKLVHCDICRDPMIDRCRWYWSFQKRTLSGDKQRLHICDRCEQAMIDMIMDKRREWDQPPVDGEEKSNA